MKFKMTAECNPRNHAQWFDGFQEGAKFEAENLEAAQDFLNAQCAAAGTDTDPNYDDHAPYAALVDDMDDIDD